MEVFETRDALRELGWGKAKASCYCALVQYGEMKASEIANHAELRQEKVYNPLTRLKNQGYVFLTDSNPQQYKAQNPRFVIQEERQQFEADTDSILEGLEEAWARSSEGITPIGEFAHVLSGKSGFRTGRSEIIDEANKSLYIADDRFAMISPNDSEALESLQADGADVRILAPQSEKSTYMSDIGADVQCRDSNNKPSYYIADKNTVMLNVASGRATVMFEDQYFAGIITSQFEEEYQEAARPDHEKQT